MFNVNGLPDFKIKPIGYLSELCIKKQLYSFHTLCAFIYELKYDRNDNKDDLGTVFTDNCGTCSTKHSLLKQVAEEQGFHDINLVLGIFKMNAINTAKISAVLFQYQLNYIPEAHNYLKYNHQIFDFTGPGFNPENYKTDILDEINILPTQITQFKVTHHQAFLKKWLAENPLIQFNITELWSIRENCIAALSE